MQEISELLARFENIIGGKRFQKQKIVQVIKDKTNISIDTESVTLSGGVLNIKTKPIIKNEILFKKEEIIEGLKNNLVSLVVEDIR